MPALLSKKTAAYIKLTVAISIWGLSFIASKVVLRELQPLMTVWLRFAFGVVILGITMWMRGQNRWPDRKEIAYFSLIGFLGITFHQWLQSTALLTTDASTSAWIVATSPVFIAFLGWLILHERLSGIQAFGILIAGGGVLLIVSKGNPASLTNGKFGSPGELLILLSAVNWAVFSVLSRRGVKKYAATYMMFYVMLAGWMFTSVMLWLSPGSQATNLVHLTLNAWGGLLFLGVFCSGVAYIFWYDGLQAIPVADVGVFLYFEPLVTLIFAALILGEAITWVSMLGGLMILFGVWLVNRSAFQELPTEITDKTHRPISN